MLLINVTIWRTMKTAVVSLTRSSVQVLRCGREGLPGLVVQQILQLQRGKSERRALQRSILLLPTSQRRAGCRVHTILVLKQTILIILKSQNKINRHLCNVQSTEYHEYYNVTLHSVLFRCIEHAESK